VKIYTIIRRYLLTEYLLFTSYIFITLLHNTVQKFGTFFMRHPVYCNVKTSITWDVRLSWLENANSRPRFWSYQRAILTRKAGQTDLTFGI